MATRHGTRSKYNNAGCRCEACTEAHRLYGRKRLLRPEALEKKRAAAKVYHLANAERLRAKTKALGDANIERIRQHKLEQGCVDCGYREHAVALQFDHLPGTLKVKELSRMRTHSRESIDAEIEKCEVVCANCHAVRTADRAKEQARASS